MRTTGLISATLLLMIAACDSDSSTATDTTSPADTTPADTSAPPTPTPFGLTLPMDGVTYVGVAEIDITPLIAETFTDLNGDGTFDGCTNDPDAARNGCDEPFDDVDNDGFFDAVWIAGFGQKRAAQDVHDPVTVRTMMIARDGEYVLLAGMDFVGLLQYRLDQARDILVEQHDVDATRYLASSSHNHQGPDVFGFWGFIDLDAGAFEAGFDVTYNLRVVDALVDTAHMAAQNLAPAEIVMGMEDMADRSPWFNGRHFGGTSPDPWVHGLIHDIRDPVIASTKVFVMHARDPQTKAGIATLLNFSSHPETWGGSNNSISADWVGVARRQIEAELGGKTVFMPEALGGMQSMLGAPIPLVDDNGTWVWDDNETTPLWAAGGTWEYVHSAGTHVADAALAAIDGQAPVALDPFEVRRETMRIHIDTFAWEFGASLSIADYDLAQMIQDVDECPGYAGGNEVGCVDTFTWRLRMGPLAAITAPGELLPEIFHGPPDDPQWALESTDPTRRGQAAGRDSRYFPQHPPACDPVAWVDCQQALKLGDCDCLAMHDLPYRLSPHDDIPALTTLLSDDAPYHVVLGATGGYFSYIIPESDFNSAVTLISERDGDHYEDTVSAGSALATALQRAQLRLGDDSP